MKSPRSEYTANMAMCRAEVQRAQMHIGQHFGKKVPKRQKDQKGFSFRAMFKLGAIK